MENDKTYISSSLSAPAGSKNFEEPTSILFRKVRKAENGALKIYQEDDDNNIVDFKGEALTFAVMLKKIERFLVISSKKV